MSSIALPARLRISLAGGAFFCAVVTENIPFEPMPKALKTLSQTVLKSV
jgi:hypothetical protein